LGATIPLDATERRPLPVADILTPTPMPRTVPRRTLLGDVPADQLRERIYLALSLLGHRADDAEVLADLVRRALLGETILALSGGAR
jgi:hypothetical protein